MTFDKRKALSYREKSEFTSSTQNHVGKENLPDGNESMEIWMGKFYLLRETISVKRGRGLGNTGNDIKRI